MPTTANNSVPRWVHGWAILTVAAALPLFFLGADVTTKGAGMADQRPVVAPTQAIAEMQAGGQSHGWWIEHSHRLAGWIIGMCGIILCALLWWKEPRRGVCWLGTLVLGLIVMQGILGMFRIQFHALFGPNLAWIHAGFAQIVLAVLVSVAVVTSPLWTNQRSRRSDLGGLARDAAWLCVLVYGQLILGGMVRHRDFFLGARLHLFAAFLVAALTVWLVKRLHDAGHVPGSRAIAGALLALLTVQIVLGIEAWLTRFTSPTLPYNQIQPLLANPTLMRTLHFVGGSLFFACSVALALAIYRSTAMSEQRNVATPDMPAAEPVNVDDRALEETAV